MKTKKQIGDMGEKIAEKYLKKRCWKILSNNFNVRGGEIDIIAYRGGTLVYVEVKTRNNEKYGRPADSVGAEKLKRIGIAAEIFRNTYVRGGKVPVFYPFGIEKKRNIRRERIDVIEVFGCDGKYKINHIKSFSIGEQL